MKNLLLVLFAAFSLQACEQKTGSGNVETEQRKVGSFRAVSVGGSIEVEIRQGSEPKLTVQADDNIIEDIETTVSGGKLRIEYADGVNISNANVKILVEAPELTAISASASADVKLVETWNSSGKVEVKASSSATVEGAMDAPTVEMEASSSGRIIMKGRTKDVDAQASSAGSIEADELLAENAKVQASSGASIRTHASLKLNAQASSGASISYRGNATVSRQESSGGSIRKLD